MRSIDRGYQPVPPPEIKTFTEHLRAAGYYASSQTKLDYQFSGVFTDAPITNWDEPSGLWHGRGSDQPFFAYITIFETHESRLLGDNSTTITDPAAVTVPPYYPDTPLVRADFARHYDNVEAMDANVGTILEMLEEEGLLEETVVIFFADNGRGFPRDKRWVYDGGIHEPLIVRWPDRQQGGTRSSELVSFIDFAPTTLALAGIDVPDHMPGRIFLGPRSEPEAQYVHAQADRMDEAPDRIRAVRDKRYKYIRNYETDTPYGQSIAFRNELVTMQEIYRLESEGDLGPPADWYFRQTKPLEELYDTQNDPFELTNLADEPEHEGVLKQMRGAHDAWVERTGDLGGVPESQLAERYWPGGVQPVTPAPVLSTSPNSDGTTEVAIQAIEGASIAYALDEIGDDARWKLYAEPLAVPAGTLVRARAVRYGWAESGEVSLVAGQ
jgi:arylsulfatase A-like enzyme